MIRWPIRAISPPFRQRTNRKTLSGNPILRSVYGLRESRFHGNEGLPHLPWHYDLWLEEVAEWVLEEEESRRSSGARWKLGINFFDTADMYSVGASEEITGRALKDFGPGRDKLVIATKVFNPMGDDPNQRGLSRKHILHAIDDSLRRLGTDYVDLYQIHRFDYERRSKRRSRRSTTWSQPGKALYIGASSMFAWQFAEDAVVLAPERPGALRHACRTTTTWSIARKSAR